VIRQHHGRMAQAARVLGMQRTNLYRKVRHLAVIKTPPRTVSNTPGHRVNVDEDSMEIR
jgi:hypothetical protein